MSYISVNSMDAPRVLTMFDESKVLMNTAHCDQLMEMLNFVEYDYQRRRRVFNYLQQKNYLKKIKKRMKSLHCLKA